MTEEQKKMKKYCNQVERRLTLPRKIKARVMTDFTTTIAALREAGKADEEIYAQLGTPKQAAAELNEQMKGFAYRKSPWRFVGLAMVVVCGLLAAYYAGIRLMTSLLADYAAASVEIIGGADGPTAIFVATSSGGINGDLVLLTVGAALGLLIWWRLSRCKQKK